MRARRIEPYHKCEVCGTIVQLLEREEWAWKNGRTSCRRAVFIDISGGRQIIASEGGIICISFWGKRIVDELGNFHVGQLVKVRFEPVCFTRNRTNGKPGLSVSLKGYEIRDAAAVRGRRTRCAAGSTTNE